MKNSTIRITRFGQNQIKKKNKKWIKAIVLIATIAVLIFAVSLKIEDIIRCSIEKLSVDNDANATWISSLASYWGGILGGIFSGIIAIFGVF